MTEVLVSPLVFLMAVMLSQGWSADHTGPRPALARPVVVGLYALLVFVLVAAALPGLGWTTGDEIPLYVVQAHGLVTAFLVLMLLQYRAHVMQKQQRHTALALERSLLQTQQERSVREEQEKLLTMLAHELKTPLATMHMRLDATSSGSREIKQAIRDMDSVIERCVQTNQLGDRQLTAHFETVDVVNILKDATSSCNQPERIHMDLPTQLLAQTDKQLLFIVLNNLLENAFKYAEPKTPILVRLWSEQSLNSGVTGLQLEVCNIPGTAGWPDPDKVFDKYYRSPNARRQAGTGLGLFLVRNVVQILGGRIDYLPDVSRIRFLLQLPSLPNTP